MGRGHPESPARLKAVMEALDAPEFAGLERREAPRAARDALALVHPAPYLERIDTVFAEAEESGERVRLDADTSVGPGSKEAALRAAGAAVAAVDGRRPSARRRRGSTTPRPTNGRSIPAPAGPAFRASRRMC